MGDGLLGQQGEELVEEVTFVLKNNNVMGVDYKLYSSVDDALNDENPWERSDYNSNHNKYGFPRNSGPHGYVGDQWNSYGYSHGHANHHAFYIEVPSGTSTA